MVQVSIGANNYESYADVATADTYLEADLRLDAIWDAATTDDKTRALVSATRILDRQRWVGEPTQPFPGTQPLAWPRTGVTGFTDTEIPTQVVNACITLAALFIETPTLAQEGSTGSNIRRVQAGTAQVEFFRPTGGTRFPDIVQELLVGLLSSTIGSGAAGSQSFGTDDVVTTPLSNSYGRDFGRSEGLS